MSVIDDARSIAESFPLGDGHIIAVVNEGRPDLRAAWTTSEPDLRVSFLKKVGHFRPIGVPLDRAHIFSTYQEAADAAQKWFHSNRATSRIIHVRVTRPFELLEDYPITVLDALAEL